MKCVLTIRNRTRYLAFVRSWVAAFAHTVGRRRFSKRLQTAVSLALIEAIDNAIFHVRPPKSKGRMEIPIRVGLAVGNDVIEITVADRGHGFRLMNDDIPDPKATHGRGLFLIRRLMTRVETRRERGWHIVRMTS